MDTYTPPHQLPFGAHVTMQNVELEQRGSVSKRWGYATYGVAVGTGALLGMSELVRNDGTKHLMKVADNGKLYTHPTTNVPIRLATPYKVTATNGVSGAVGANLAPGTKYQYAIVAVDATGKTMGSHTIDSTSGEVTTGGTAYPITVAGHGVYGAATYEVYRRTYSGSYGAWGRMTTGLTDTTASGATTVTYTDDGNTAPDTVTDVPASNTTDYSLSTTQLVDFIVVRQGGNNVLTFTNGSGICFTNGTTAQLVQPATETIAGDPLTENRLWDKTNPVYTVRGLHYHHRHIFGGDAEDFPQRFFWSDVDDLTYWPQDGFINVPDPGGGRVLDFITKDDALVVGLTTSLYALFGTSFATSGPTATGNYFSRISEVGVASEWTMRNGPGGVVLYHGSDKQPYYLAAVSPVKEQVIHGKLIESMKPTLEVFTDHANASSTWDGTQYILTFPADKQVVRTYFFDLPDGGKVVAPVLDVMPDGMVYLTRRLDGTLLGADDDSGQLWELYKSSTYLDNATAVEMSVKTGSLGCGYDGYKKKFFRLIVVYQAGDDFTTEINVSSGSEQADSKTLTSVGDALYGTATYGTSRYPRTGAKTTVFSLGKRGHYARIEFSNSETDERPTLFGFHLEHTPYNRAKGED
jgi:hypothetical protein